VSSLGAARLPLPSLSILPVAHIEFAVNPQDCRVTLARKGGWVDTNARTLRAEQLLRPCSSLRPRATPSRGKESRRVLLIVWWLFRSKLMDERNNGVQIFWEVKFQVFLHLR
jgi:hypothetical protein